MKPPDREKPSKVDGAFVPSTDTPTLLIVDDDPVIRSLMRDSLEDDGFTVIEAKDGIEACKRCDSEVPALIVVDAMMPTMDGFELCRALRRQPQTAQIPILMATGLDDSNSIARAYEVGATDFIAKPINWLMLSQRIRYMLRAAHAFDELRQNQERLLAAKDTAERANKAKSEFLANMSHELRTPLNAIIGFASIMQEGLRGPLDARYVEDAKIILDSGNHLLAIINDILDIAKAEANSLELAEDMIDIAETAAFSAEMVAEMAKNGRVDCSWQVDDGLPAFWGDAKKLRQVLINLLSNAVKFTPEGGSVTLRARRSAEGGAAITVADTGIGMAPEDIPVALAPFGQVDGSLSRGSTTASASACRCQSGWSRCMTGCSRSRVRLARAPRSRYAYRLAASRATPCLSPPPLETSAGNRARNRPSRNRNRAAALRCPTRSGSGGSPAGFRT